VFALLGFYAVLRWVIPVVLSKYEYVRNNIFVYSHKTQLYTIKYVYYIYYNDMFRPSTAIIRLYMKTSSIYTIDHRSSLAPSTGAQDNCV